MIHIPEKPRRLSQRAQSMLEYTTITVLVMVGIFVMGPYLVRAVNSYFKTTDDAVNDSMSENIQQAPPTGKPFPTCTCAPLSFSICGDGVTCPRREEVWSRTCAPVGCESSYGSGFVMQECRNNLATPPSCCDPAVPTGDCGVNATHITGVRLDGLNGCEDGEMEMAANCGSPVIWQEYGCQLDAACVFSCTIGGAALPPPGGIEYTGLCPGDDTGLTGNTPYYYVAPGGCSVPPGARKCEVECAPGYAPTNP